MLVSLTPPRTPQYPPNCPTKRYLTFIPTCELHARKISKYAKLKVLYQCKLDSIKFETFPHFPLVKILILACIVLVAMCRMVQVLVQTVFIFFARRMLANQIEDSFKKPGRELVTFLLMVNLAMFLINMFETQKSGSNPVTIEFYGKSVWTMIVYSTGPLNTFFR